MTTGENNAEPEVFITHQRTGLLGIAVNVLGAVSTLYHIFFLRIYPIDPWLFLSGSLCFFAVTTFLLFPGSKQPTFLVAIGNLILCLLFIVSTAYVMLNYDDMYGRVGYAPTVGDWVFGTIIVLLVLEMARRVLGWFFPAIAALGIIYAVFGGALPSFLGHRGYEFERVVSTLYSSEGIYGFAMSAAATYIVLFVTFGAFLRATGVGPVFMDLATAVAGPWRGGPAKVSVLSSAMFGTISGSSMANVAALGLILQRNRSPLPSRNRENLSV